ncbi:Orn/Lys/Arg family decarboxylase [Amycolatopsis alkalitolerans]|uniref:Orn/Lys/Arg decarboxylase C-terminal domain-containing protein n=1 Tax=Amycolatopsis alkalitolerans TaxID=2547244 RepID=A0A5C4LWE1_9PSEU|nr:hypothetical protein [Amycolatopsis alkalitolerans]TNC23762.1 hypothetical protein FG385_20615 [Amycolatopsis alkalitolerans]
MGTADWRAARCPRRIAAQLTIADDEDTTPAPELHLPAPTELELEQAMSPREAFFGPAEHVPTQQAAGRVAAETLSPYPPGVPVVLPGEILTQPVIDYLRSGVVATMLIPDATDEEEKWPRRQELSSSHGS